jgi:hypothetical protein
MSPLQEWKNFPSKFWASIDNSNDHTNDENATEHGDENVPP